MPGIEKTDATDPSSEPLAIQDAAPIERSLRAGDQVAVNRGWVNCRAWMSTDAHRTGILKMGHRAEVLNDPVRSCGYDWVKLRPAGATNDCFLAARYLELIEAGAVAPPAEAHPPASSAITGTPYRAGDIFTTRATVNVRAGAGKEHRIIQVVSPNSLGTALTDSRTIDSVEWIQVQFPAVSGWLSARYTQLVASRERWIEVDISTQTLTAWDDAVRVSTSPISSGKPGFDTPTGTFSISAKYPARRTKATVRDEHWDIPGVPWIMVFRAGGFYLHGVYWHDDFGAPVSHGCVTLPVPYAEWLYNWTPIGARIWIHH